MTIETISRESASTVVLNDKKVGIPVVSPTATNVASKTLFDLESNRKQWESTAYRTSNQQLYSVLADCLAYGGDLPIDQAKARNAELAEFFSSRGYSVKSDSPLLTRIVKAVFGNVDRRRISTYSLVLRTAKADEILPKDLAQWIEDSGGIQEVKLKRNPNFVSPKDKASTAKKSFGYLPNLAVVKTKELSLLADADFHGDGCVLLAEQQTDGSFAIKALTRSGSAMTAAMSALYVQQQKATVI